MAAENLPRVVVVGTTGSGKTTLAKQLASLFGVLYGELDAINWQPNRTGLSIHDRPEFRRRVEAAILAPDGCAVDGNYCVVRDLVWLDFVLWITMWRLHWRTLRRIRIQEVLWGGQSGMVPEPVPEPRFAVHMGLQVLPAKAPVVSAYSGPVRARTPAAVPSPFSARDRTTAAPRRVWRGSARCRSS
jgi:energy-coupling factor transporter ATP-binding protein EcfA2